MTSRSKHICSLLLLLLVAHVAFADYRVRAKAEAVPASGFYMIPVTPEITAHASADFSTIKIRDDRSVEIPYIKSRNLTKVLPVSFVPFRIVNRHSEKRYTTIILENTTKGSIGDITLLLANAAAERKATLSGSSDKSRWFIIDDDVSLHHSPEHNKSTYSQTIGFPQSNYRYFKLKIDNTGSDPLNVTSAGIYRTGAMQEGPTVFVNAKAEILQTDSNDHTSYIDISLPDNHLTDRLILYVSGPRFYHREGLVAEVDIVETNEFLDTIASFTLISGQPNVIHIPPKSERWLRLEIDNKDNPPLHIDSVFSAQEAQYLVAWLEKDRHYDIISDYSETRAPQYDLAHFKDSIPTVIPILSVGKMIFEPTEPVSATAQKHDAAISQPQQNTWLWPTIIVSVIILSLLTYRLMKDVKQNNTQ